MLDSDFKDGPCTERVKVLMYCIFAHSNTFFIWKQKFMYVENFIMFFFSYSVMPIDEEAELHVVEQSDHEQSESSEGDDDKVGFIFKLFVNKIY